MKLEKIIFIIILFVSIGFKNICTAQDIPVFSYGKHLIPQPTHSTIGADKKGFLGASFRFYKKYISSQDGNSCTFHPSCSEYSTQIIAKKGAIIGMMLTFDRLARCNGLSPEKYKFDPKTRLLIDEVED